VANVFIKLISKLGNKSKQEDQTNFYFVKLLSVKNENAWDNRIISSWLAMKRLVTNETYKSVPTNLIL
jgi:hypothetical protein